MTAFLDAAGIATVRLLRILIRFPPSFPTRLAFERPILNYWKGSRNGPGVRSGSELCF